MVALPQISIDTDLSEGLCFGCGQNNPIGLKLSFKQEDTVARAEFTPGKHHQGWPGVVHGGIITCLLDEAMSYAANFAGVHCLTAQMEVKLRRSALINELLVITSSITKRARKLVKTKAEVTLRDGTVIAEGMATQFVVAVKSGNAGNKGKRSQKSV